MEVGSYLYNPTFNLCIKNFLKLAIQINFKMVFNSYEIVKLY